MMQANKLAQQVGDRLRRRQMTLAVAESCTGGLLGDLITDIPGSSDYFLGGVLSYSNQVKHRLLGVQAETLAGEGAVSAQCAAEMAQGVRRLVQSDVALSITGIAGPGGGSDGKPKGLTYLHLSAPGCERGQRFIWPGDRRANKLDAARAALHLLLDYLESTEQAQETRFQEE
ncbi:MAG TPA: CinA family protein [Anaerolineae bacterium]|nr:CinA family protein [Anaerolineae bacterium]HNU05525.1 CinA family protein [Anaerolineae bacterium]